MVKLDYTSCQGYNRSGRRIEAPMSMMLEKLLKVRELVEVTGILKSAIPRILTENLMMFQ